MKAKRLINHSGDEPQGRRIPYGEVGAALFWNGNTNKFFVVPQSEIDINVYPKSTYTPVGLYVRNDRIMSLKEMSRNNPEEGGYSTIKIWESRNQRPTSGQASTSGDALSDFDGISKSNALFEETRGNNPTLFTQTPLPSSLNGAKARVSLPTVCAYRYCPIGTNPGDWYIPSLGELNLFKENLETNQRTLELLSTYDSEFVPYYEFDSAGVGSINFQSLSNPSYYWGLNFGKVYKFSMSGGAVLWVAFLNVEAE